jgi:hypothetical protein
VSYQECGHTVSALVVRCIETVTMLKHRPQPIIESSFELLMLNSVTSLKNGYCTAEDDFD